MAYPITTAPRDGSFIYAWIEGSHPVTGEEFTKEMVRWDESASCWLPEAKQIADRDDRDWKPTHWDHHNPSDLPADVAVLAPITKGEDAVAVVEIGSDGQAKVA